MCRNAGASLTTVEAPRPAAPTAQCTTPFSEPAVKGPHGPSGGPHGPTGGKRTRRWGKGAAYGPVCVQRPPVSEVGRNVSQHSRGAGAARCAPGGFISAIRWISQGKESFCQRAKRSALAGGLYQTLPHGDHGGRLPLLGSCRPPCPEQDTKAAPPQN